VQREVLDRADEGLDFEADAVGVAKEIRRDQAAVGLRDDTGEELFFSLAVDDRDEDGDFLRGELHAAFDLLDFIRRIIRGELYAALVTVARAALRKSSFCGMR